MELVQVSDASYLLAEGRAHPMHVGMLLFFDPPDGARPGYVQKVYERILTNGSLAHSFRKHPVTSLAGVGSLAWGVEGEFELGYHVRRLAVPAPGELSGLFAIVSDLHEALLDRGRPLWEAYLVEGLSDGRFAMYLKVHRALMDCPGVMRRIMATLSVDAKGDSAWAPWHIDDATVEDEQTVSSLLRSGTKKASGLAGLLPGSARQALKAFSDVDLAVPYRAPKTMFNVPVGPDRVVVGQSWSIDRLLQLRTFTRAPGIDEVMLAILSGAMRSYLLERRELPTSSLVALTPASARFKLPGAGDVFCRLGTDKKSPKERMDAVISSMESAKGLVGQTSALAWSFASMTPRILDGVPGLNSLTRPPFNLTVTKVPGLRDRMFWNGARLAGVYPLSFVSDGLALSVGYTNTSENLEVGLVACRRTVPDAGHILEHMDKALTELETYYR